MNQKQIDKIKSDAQQRISLGSLAEIVADVNCVDRVRVLNATMASFDPVTVLALAEHADQCLAVFRQLFDSCDTGERRDGKMCGVAMPSKFAVERAREYLENLEAVPDARPSVHNLPRTVSSVPTETVKTLLDSVGGLELLSKIADPDHSAVVSNDYLRSLAKIAQLYFAGRMTPTAASYRRD